MGQVANRAQNSLKSRSTENWQEAVNICTCISLDKKKKPCLRQDFSVNGYHKANRNSVSMNNTSTWHVFLIRNLSET